MYVYIYIYIYMHTDICISLSLSMQHLGRACQALPRSVITWPFFQDLYTKPASALQSAYAETQKGRWE